MGFYGGGESGPAAPASDIPFLLGSRFQVLDEGTEGGLVAGRTSRVKHTCAGTTQKVRLLYANWQGNSTESNVGNPIFVRSSVEVGSVITPLLFGGQTEVQIPDGGQVWTDWAEVTLVKGQGFFTRDFVRVASVGQNTPRGIAVFDSEGIADGADLTQSGTAFTRVGNFTFSSVAAQGQSTKKSGVIIYGDSIPTGGGDFHDTGYPIFGLEGRVGVVNCAKGNESSFNLSLTGKRVALAQYGTHALYAYGQNDMSAVQTFATVRDRMQARIDVLAAAGLKVVMTPVPPRGGTLNTNFDAGGTWQQLNDWIYAVPPNVYAVLDLNRVWGQAATPHLWIAGRNADSLHPSTLGHRYAGGVAVEALTRGVFS